MQRFLPISCCVFLLCAVGCLPAQEPPRPPTKPPVAVQKPSGWGEHDFPLREVLADYGKLIGKKVVQDNTVNGGSPVTLPDIDGTEPQERASLIEWALFLGGHTLVDADKDTVVILGPGKNPRAVGLPIYTRPEEWPAGERVFSHLFKLEHADPIQVAGFLQQFIPPGNDVNFSAAEKSHLLIATAPTSVMRTVLRVVVALETSENAVQ